MVAFASTITRPAVGSMRRFTMRSSVVFPEPLRPSSAVVEPWAICKLTWSRMTRPSGVVSPTCSKAMAGRFRLWRLDVKSWAAPRRPRPF